ncbi:pentapeptide repeat-containing protein, partial [Botrimarina hoheduenensis]|uniref:pentapeptide repeat-containing protein n=1 Tax=Botrimarina hoheduenensis TaxID=2528000 RepID=UPI0011B7804B
MPRPVSFEQQEIGAANIERFVDDVEAAAAAGNPIEIDRCRFTVAVDLTGLRATAGLRFTRCRFYQPVRLARTRIEGVLVLRGCYFRRGLDLSDARVEGPLDLGASWFRRPGLTPREDLVRYGLEDDYPAAAVYAVRLHVAGETMLKRAGSLGNVLFRQAELGKNFDATGIHL